MALVQIQETPKWKKLLSFVGPGFLVSVAYLDPGNLETDLQAGRHLSEHCKMEYPKPVNYSLWILAEVAVIAADIPEVIGTAFALEILFKVPMWIGVLLAGLNTLLLLGLQRYGIRKLEIVIGVLVLVVGGCFFSVMVRASPDPKEIMTGMFAPKLSSVEATKNAIALLGALIMPHNLFLHSALVISRKIPHSFEGIRNASKYFLLESGIALFFAFLINVAVVSVTGSVCFHPNISPENRTDCKNITLDSAVSLLKNALGEWSSKLYAISLLAAGQSSTVTGTYAGQYIMQGFLEMKMELWLRNLITRFIAITPSLLVCIIGGSSGAARLIIIASMILSFELPFALIPLLRITSSAAKMGCHKNSFPVTLITWLLGLGVTGINIYFLSTSFMGWIKNNRTGNKGRSIVAGLCVFPIMMLYIAALAYLTFKKERDLSGIADLRMNSSHGSSANGSNAGSENGSIPMTLQRVDENEDVIVSA
ncbi:Natural resistance-associated macrophage protein [Corchorus olitorius]|uniref:Natural resistance-associated macrophage protein n=1 Tax=Corchorus olitorius TaxID=93759 RepID=A0A1R3HS14_9ROSI|nr:Natural resistance-associated macrophage protein [Corchorus olitorius]